MNSHFVPIEADRVYKLLNIGATTLVSACYEDNADVMPAAWADDRIYRDGRWLFEKADKSMSTLHYVAGGHFYTMGEPIDVEI